jgi:hypothetical protein
VSARIAQRPLKISRVAVRNFAVLTQLKMPISIHSIELILEAIGALLIGLSGFLGGSLVLNDLIGPHT